MGTAPRTDFSNGLRVCLTPTVIAQAPAYAGKVFTLGHPVKARGISGNIVWTGSWSLTDTDGHSSQAPEGTLEIAA